MIFIFLVKNEVIIMMVSQGGMMISQGGKAKLFRIQMGVKEN